MKEMVYQPALKERDILDSGEYNGYKYYIVSLGTHPCAYVEVPEGHICYGKCDGDAYVLDIDVHGGITFGNFGLKGVSDKFLLGWDYNHCDDYCFAVSDSILSFFDFGTNGKRWTTEEMLEDVKSVINRLREM
jgi:hypothetical protein